jgi:hypothetical protein
MDDFSIAIWNKNRVVVAISLGVWMTNIAFLIQGESARLSLNLFVCQESHTDSFEFRYCPGKYGNLLYPSMAQLCLQLRSTWVPAEKRCVVYDTESNKPNIIVTLITDIMLLLIMLVGLLRLRRYGVGTFGLGQLLWKQVGFSVRAVALHSLMHTRFQGCYFTLHCYLRRGYASGMSRFCSTSSIFSLQYVTGVYFLGSERYLSPARSVDDESALNAILLQTQTRLTLYVCFFATLTDIE